MWRNYRLSLSLANLIYLRAWADLIPMRSSGLYHRRTLPGFGLYFALVGDVLALSLLIYLVIRVAPRLPGWLRRMLPVAAIAMLALSTAFLRAHLPHLLPMSVIALLFVAAEILACVFYATAVRLIKGLALAAIPCVAVTFLAPLYYLSHPPALPPTPAFAQRLPGAPPVRVIWVVFDEWDQRLTFGDADTFSKAPVPTLLNLASRSFAATHALAAQAGIVPIYDMATVAAIPSLIYGKLVTHEETGDPASRRLYFADGQSVVFGAGDNIFSRVRSLGWNSAIAGWFLPYCRVFAPLVSDCYWDEMFDQGSSASHAPLQAAFDESRMLFETKMYSPFGRALVVERHLGEYEALIAAAKRYAADPSIGVAFVHFNVPHMPYLDTPGLTHLIVGSPDTLYLDELRWVDRAVGEILSALGSSGLDSKTALILSSDHPARLVSRLTPYVPFIVHLPGFDAGMVSKRQFSALDSEGLVLAIASGKVQSPLEIEDFLASHR